MQDIASWRLTSGEVRTLRLFPMDRVVQFFRHEPKIEPLPKWMPLDTAKPFRKSLRIAVLAAWG